MTDTIGNASNCTDPPCILNGKLNGNWQKVKDSKTQVVRFGGITPDKNMPTNFQYIRMIDSIRSNGMEPIVQVPYYNGRYTAQQAAAIVTYINVTRNKHVKYWIIGNEPDLKYAATSASQVASYIKPFASAMKAVDSTIRIIGPETAWFNKAIIDGLTNPGGTYDITGKDNNGRYYVDVISFHTYPMGDNNATLPTRSQLIAKLTGTNSFESNLTYLNTRLTAANNYHSRAGTDALLGAVTEANVVYANSSTDNVYGVGANSFLGAQFVAELYGIGLTQGLAFMNLWSTIEGSSTTSNIGFIDKSTGNKKPLFYHYKMMAEHFSGNSVSANDNQANVKVFAGKNGQKTTVMIMNQESTTDHAYSLRLNNATVTGTNSLKINVNAGIAAQYNDTIRNQSTLVLQFDGSGNITRKAVYSLSVHAANNLPPTYIDYPVIDLVITSASVSAQSGTAGTAVNVQASIYNNGSSTASVSNVGYYLSADSIFGSGDVLLGSSAGTALQATTSALRQSSLVIPTNIAAGNYYILFKADYNNVVSEVNENNNVASKPFTVDPTPLVDLVIQNAVGTPTNVLAGGVISLTSNIVNTGTTTSFGGKIGYYISSDTLLDSGDGFLAFSSPATLTPNSNAQKTKTVTIASTMPAGIFYILFKADYAQEIAETNELNNLSRVKINISQPASVDLAISNAALSASVLLQGAAFSVSATIANTGSTNAASSKVGYYLSSDTLLGSGDSFLGFSTGGQLNAGANSSKQATLQLPSGTAVGQYYVLINADYDLAVTETNENNNTRYVGLVVNPIPSVDLRIASKAISSASILAGGSLSFTCTVINSGSTSAGISKAGYYLSVDTLLDNSDILLANSATSTLSAGSSVLLNKSASLTAVQPGIYNLIFVADYAAEVGETNESNNTARLTFTIAALPKFADLQVQNQAVSSATITAGNKFLVNSKLVNAGNANALSGKTGYFLSQDTSYQSYDIFLGSSSVGSLSPAAGILKTFSGKVPLNQNGGNYYILFFADYDGLVTESNENNNIRYVPVKVVARKMDLSVTSLKGSRSISGTEPVQLSVSLLNNSSDPVMGSVTYYFSGDDRLDQSDILLDENNAGELSAGENRALEAHLLLPDNTLPGTYYIFAVTDRSGQLTESDEMNNLQKHMIVVSPVATGLEQADMVLGIKLYPNPSKGHFTVESDLQNDALLEVLDVSGQVVYSRNIERSAIKHEVDLSGSLQAGVYFVRLQSAAGSVTKSILLTR